MSRPVRITLLVLFLSGVLAAAGAGAGYWYIKSRLNGAQFKSKIENVLSRVMSGTVRIEELEVRVGLRPWVAARGFTAELAEGRISIKAREIQLFPRLKPLLLERRLQFSEIAIDGAEILARRTRRGSWPRLTLEPQDPPDDGPARIRIEEVSLTNSRVDLVDEAWPGRPVVRVFLEAILTRPENGPIGVEAKAKLAVGGGPILIKGTLAPPGPFTVTAERLPLAALRGHLPILSIFSGEVALAGELNGESWRGTVQTKKLFWAQDREPIPLSISGRISSRGPLTAEAQWSSPGTEAQLSLKAKTWRGPDYALNVQGERVAVPELKALIQRILRADGPVSLVDFRQIQWRMDYRFSEVTADKGALQNLAGSMAGDKAGWTCILDHGETLGGTVYARLTGFRYKGKLARMTLEAAAQNADLAPLATAFSTSPFLLGGRLTGRVNLSGAVNPWNTASLSGQIEGAVRDGALADAPALYRVFTALKLGPLFESLRGTKSVGLPFEVVTATATILNGRLTTDHPLYFQNPTLEMAYTGWLDLASKKGKGLLVLNLLTGTRNLVEKIPGVSSIFLGPEGTFLPMVVDVEFSPEEVKTDAKLVKSVSGSVVGVALNVLKLPGKILRGGKKDKTHS